MPSKSKLANSSLPNKLTVHSLRSAWFPAIAIAMAEVVVMVVVAATRPFHHSFDEPKSQKLY